MGGDEGWWQWQREVTNIGMCLVTAIDKQIVCLAIGMCQLNNWIPVAFCSCESGDHSGLNSRLVKFCRTKNVPE
jgi:hypothetical protein